MPQGLRPWRSEKPLIFRVEKFWKYKVDHALFWAITIGFHIYTRLYLIEQAGFGHFALEILVRNGLLAIIIYVHLDYLIPLFAQRRKLISYLLGLVGCFVFYVIAKNIHDVYLDRIVAIDGISFWNHSFYNFSIALFYMAFSLALQLSKEWFFQREKLRLMEIEKLNTELEYLKLQINPHFLFNSLNTIYFQIDKANGIARETLLKFSDLLRYPLYECNGKEVALKKELEYIKNYFDLQRLRKDENYQVSLKCDITDTNQMVAPLLLVPFIENAFKHISHFSEHANIVKVEISREHKLLRFYVFNTTEQSGQPDPGTGGIGLKNVRRRLDLIYGDSYLLDIRQAGKEFEVNLILPLHEAALPDH
jgi:two-component system LytT family sensor kinase